LTRELVSLDIGGTHARFAHATIADDGAIALDEPITLKTSDYVSLNTAWDEFERRSPEACPPQGRHRHCRAGKRRYGADDQQFVGAPPVPGSTISWGWTR